MILKKLLQFFLNILAQLYLWRYRPVIVAITGSVGKTSSKEAIAAVLRKFKNIRTAPGNLNDVLGVPLAIIGDWDYSDYEDGDTAFFWLKAVWAGFWFFVFGWRGYPEVLILEFGADKPGDIAYLVHKYRPHIGVITAVGEIPVHVEFFSDPDDLAKEKRKLVSALAPSDYAVLNHDDQAVYDMKEKTKAKVISYGFTEGSTVRFSNYDFRLDENNHPAGIRFKAHQGANTFVPVSLNGVLGPSHVFSAGAALAVAGIFGINLIEASQALAHYAGPNGRMKILQGIKNSLIIDDTYNSSPAAAHLAVETLSVLPAKRRIFITGDMLELGRYTIKAHQELGNLAGGKVDVLVCVGARSRFAADAAANQMNKESIFMFETADSAKIKIQELIGEGDLVLVKGSQSMRMEKIVEEIMAEPERRRELLVRQGRRWRRK